ncbi:helix-turn-helix domain-containing protein [Chryseobacterium rhizosphaerae]|uniref:helix-turn-helix domain-containing protein n=1 Tax=Chryseobacterium rhizosphaerae TaxID=395937 RepID=UPI0023590B5B|nr:helix-turn-helix domain-containing protein [Chryseobacterium rhizosphaerae]MDC8101665.1 helix-turn-helix domain-containing protein [Chryseobacterium rhizosphaerae]
MNLSSKSSENSTVQSLDMFTEQILNFKQAAEFLSISLSALYKITHKKAITFYKPNGKLIYFKKSDLIKWMLSNEQQCQAEFAEDYLNTLKTKRNG